MYSCVLCGKKINKKRGEMENEKQANKLPDACVPVCVCENNEQTISSLFSMFMALCVMSWNSLQDGIVIQFMFYYGDNTTVIWGGRKYCQHVMHFIVQWNSYWK